MSFEIGERVGDYRITGVLGAGGSGEVYRAEHTITKRVEALKVLAPGRAHNTEEEQRFLREIQLHASLAHPNIASVHNAFSTKLGLVLVMELVEGESLEAILRRGRIPVETGVGYVLQVLSALAHAHANSVLHRDVKPGNIVIAPDGTVKLTDFGLARQTANPRLTQTGTPAGSPYYMSPEQIHGVAPVDARSDVYSTGAVLYEVAAGRRPFEGESAFEVMQAHVECAPPAPIEIEPALSPALNQAILIALAKDPGQRFQSAAEFRDAIEAACAGNGRIPAAARRAPRAMAVGLCAAAAIAVALGAIILAGVVHSGEDKAVAPAPAQPVQAVEAPAPAAPPQEVPPPPEQPAVIEETAAAPEVREPPPAPKKVQRVSRREPPPAAQPKPVSQPLPVDASEPAADSAPVAGEAGESVPAGDAAAAETEQPKVEAAPKKQGNRLWRALGRIARPFKGSKKPEAEPSQARPE